MGSAMPTFVAPFTNSSLSNALELPMTIPCSTRARPSGRTLDAQVLKTSGQDSCEAGIQFRRCILVFKIDLIRRTHDPSTIFLFLHDFIKKLLNFCAGALGEIRLRLLGTGNAFLRL